jgi:hypothetical protein
MQRLLSYQADLTEQRNVLLRGVKRSITLKAIALSITIGTKDTEIHLGNPRTLNLWMAMFTLRAELSIVWLWRNSLAEGWSQEKTFIIKMATRQTTELTI